MNEPPADPLPNVISKSPDAPTSISKAPSGSNNPSDPLRKGDWASGLMSFESFMRMALYDPQRGYYAKHIRGIGGGKADFTTVPARFGKLLAAAIARWAISAMRRTGCRDWIEMGPGEGVLMREVMRALPWYLRLRVRCHFVETSDVLKLLQRQKVGKYASWHATPADAMQACDGRALVFSNELVDAFPVRVFRKSGSRWMELGVDWPADGVGGREVWGICEDMPDSSIFDQNHNDGQRVEVHDSYHAWLEDWLPTWRAGEMLTIDYGNEVSGLYHRRPQGSLRGYLMHQRVIDAEIYQNIGMQDLTADVNFTDLSRWSMPWCESDPPQTLASFLDAYSESSIPTVLADIDGAGGAFRVLCQRPRK